MTAAHPISTLSVIELRNAENWKETKYVLRGEQLLASDDVTEVSLSSRLAANLFAARYFEALRLHASGRLLDLGCGKAPLYGVYRNLVNEVTCIDWGNSLHQTTYLDKEADLTQPIDYPDGAFDTIVLSDVLEHIPVPMDLCLEISRLLSPGGKLIMSVPFYYPLHEAPHDYYRYTEFALRRFMDHSGMRIVCLNPVGGAVEIVLDVISKNIRRLPLGGTFTAQMLQAVGWWFAKSRLGVKLAQKTSTQFPLGYFMIAERLV
ncbi:class I SAM-dependent methyltransferase [Bradyrhizobium sp. F1.13.3]|uniref:class I SAM-dependent methyltransferase n=1 Tax=Bradyrhizobium sp. F1.13.3 TaxID=3156351 RepID=UPI003392BE4D